LALDEHPQRLASGMQAYELQLDLSGTAPVTMDLMASPDGGEFTRLRFDPEQGSVSVDKTHASLSAENEGPLRLQGHYDRAAFGVMRRLRVFVDGSVVDVFVNDAAAYSLRSYPTLPASTGLRLSSDRPMTAQVQLWPLRPPP
ncbi:GH32 C-terminal domain-containing protein, partial [Ideonella azotifigens]